MKTYKLLHKCKSVISLVLSLVVIITLRSLALHLPYIITFVLLFVVFDTCIGIFNFTYQKNRPD